jgi:hypothetical protein
LALQTGDFEPQTIPLRMVMEMALMDVEPWERAKDRVRIGVTAEARGVGHEPYSAKRSTRCRSLAN